MSTFYFLLYVRLGHAVKRREAGAIANLESCRQQSLAPSLRGWLASSTSSKQTFGAGPVQDTSQFMSQCSCGTGVAPPPNEFTTLSGTNRKTPSLDPLQQSCKFVSNRPWRFRDCGGRNVKIKKLLLIQTKTCFCDTPTSSSSRPS